MINIRLLKQNEAAAYKELYLLLDAETPFRLYEKGERDEGLSGFQEEVNRFTTSAHSAIIVAEDTESGKLVGYLQAIGRPQRRVRHVVSVNVAILQAYTGLKIGGMLFSFLEDWARQRGVTRLDLTVMQNNFPAQKLYKRLGFMEEGVKKGSMRVDNASIDEIYMSKRLS